MGTFAIRTDECLAILLWNTCNARCSHCGPNSGPQDKTGIPHQRILELIQEAGRIYPPGWCFSVSGGEVFLHYDRLCEYVAEVKINKGYSTLITNCYWAITPDRAERMLLPLAENDLRKLGVSFDIFHAPFVPLQYVINAIKAARKLGIIPHLRSVASRSGRLWQVLQQIEDAEVWYTEFMEMPLVPDGRARNIPEDQLFFRDALPIGKCPSASLTFNPYGKAMVCCNGGGSYPPLQIADVATHTLAESEMIFSADPTLNYLRNVGPADCIRFLDANDQATVQAKKYVNECHLCIELFSNSERAKRIKISLEGEFLKSAQIEFRALLEAVAS